ncbi:GAF domain-containing protein [Aliiruegeria haliotis]|uniref:GAF domain-containing protein n=1 Tax=Aliiruegeria haliotis TaxID=1280846 RepID=A0A2T0RJR6_9RHOB|nr:GAF domain-containing protein [Aliiruegeria haliotis]PRY21419.1 GAF domain-containing protein [Aliiruegeria haliotis]
MMDIVLDTPTRTFVEVSEVWVPEGDRLVLAEGNYGDLKEFAAASGQESFGFGEGLPGKAWSDARPVVLKAFEGSCFKRTEAAKAAGLTSAVAVPVFDGETLKAVLVLLCADDSERTGAIEVWQARDDILRLADGYYGSARHFEWVSRHTHFPKGQGLPGAVWAASTPILMRDLGSGYKFIRSESAGKAGLTTGLGLPVPVPGNDTFVLTLLSARGTPLARRFEIWDARSARVGRSKEAVLVDGICAREGPLWSDETERRAAAWQGPIGKVIGSGLPQVMSGTAGLPADYSSFIALPIHQQGELAYIVALYI